MNELNFDCERRGGGELPAQRWPGGPALLRVDATEYFGAESGFEPGTQVVLEWQDVREGVPGRWEEVARFSGKGERIIAMSPGLVRFRIDTQSSEPRAFRLSLSEPAREAKPPSLAERVARLERERGPEAA